MEDKKIDPRVADWAEPSSALTVTLVFSEESLSPDDKREIVQSIREIWDFSNVSLRDVYIDEEE